MTVDRGQFLRTGIGATAAAIVVVLLTAASSGRSPTCLVASNCP